MVRQAELREWIRSGERSDRPLDTSTWHTYTEEEPNSLTVDEVPRFMAKARAGYPQHFARLALGLATGRRPSELRPLRRQGPTSDILWGPLSAGLRRRPLPLRARGEEQSWRPLSTGGGGAAPGWSCGWLCAGTVGNQRIPGNEKSLAIARP